MAHDEGTVTAAQIGDTVCIPRPFGSLPAKVVQIFGAGEQGHVVVEIPVYDAWGTELESETAVFPVSVLRCAEEPVPRLA